MSEFLQHLENQIRSRDLLPRGRKILVAVSGGLDSMTLLHALKKLSAKHQWQLVVAHFNHRLRGRASNADEKLVRKTAAVMKLRMIAESADVKAFAAKSKLSIEMAARKLRHEFLARIARRNKIRVVALAHHADDQVELFFLRLLRGTGGDGLAGMKCCSPSPVDAKITLVRPLLDFSKRELADFARENKIQFRDDSTNYSSDILRNRIRNELLPLLRKNYQPGLGKAVLRLMEIIGAEAEFISEAARLWVRRRRVDESQAKNGIQPETPYVVSYSFECSPVAIQRRVLQRQLAELGIVADFDLIESLRQSANVFVSVGATMSVARSESGEIKLRRESKPEFTASEQAANLAGRAGETVFGGEKFKWQIGLCKKSQKQLASAVAKAKCEFFDADKIGSTIVLRHWRPGDRFQPIGLKSRVKLQDLFTNAKIPRDRRRNLVVATAADGEIFWVEGLRIGENFKLTARTKRCLIWRWRKAG